MSIFLHYSVLHNTTVCLQALKLLAGHHERLGVLVVGA